MSLLSAIRAVTAGERLWRMAHPVTRVKRALNKRRARHGKPLLEINTPEEVDIMNGQQIQGIVRHILTTLGGSLVTAGVVTEGQLETLIGALVIVGGVAWSCWQKRQAS